jgi:hypothetical protein
LLEANAVPEITAPKLLLALMAVENARLVLRFGGAQAFVSDCCIRRSALMHLVLAAEEAQLSNELP